MTFGQDDLVMKELQAQTESYLTEEEQKMEQAIRWLIYDLLLPFSSSFALLFLVFYSPFLFNPHSCPNP